MTANNTAQFGFARFGLISLGQYGRADTVVNAITDSSAKGTSNYFITAWVQEPISTSNPLFDLLHKIDDHLLDLENRTPELVTRGSTEVIFANDEPNLLFDLLHKIDEHLLDLENRSPELVNKGSTEVIIFNKIDEDCGELDRVNYQLDRLRNKKSRV